MTRKTSLLLLVIAWQQCYAQDLYHSPYSAYGLGLLHEQTSSLNRGIGGTGIAVRDDQNLNHMNPASYTAIIFPLSHIFEVGSYVEANQYRTPRLFESKTFGGLTNLSYWFRFRTWYASSFGLSPFSSVSYNVTTKKQIAISQEATYVFEGSGNMTRLFWGNGFKLTDDLSLGVTISYVFGSVTRNETVTADDASNILTLQRQTFGNKLQTNFGVQYKIDWLGRALIIGAVYDRGITLQGKNDFMLTDMNYDTLADYRGDKVEYRLPEQFGAGVSLKSKRSVLTSDIRLARWSTASYPTDDVSFRDSWKLSAGYAYHGNELAQTYLQLIGFRMGVHLQEHYLIVKKTPLSNWGATAGVSLPVSDGRSLVNITYAYDRIGESHVILHTSQKLQLDIVIRDIWGKKRKFD